MPIPADQPLPADQRVNTSERLWTEEVGIAKGNDPIQRERDIAYEWSNGRKFEDGRGPYIP